MPTSVPLHCGAQGQQRTLDIGAQHGLPIVSRTVGDGLARPADTGIGETAADRAQCGNRCVERDRDILLVADVARHGDALARETQLEFVKRRARQIPARHAGAGRCQSVDDAATDP